MTYYREVELNKLKFGLQQYLSSELIDLKADVRYDHFTQMIVAEITGYILSEDLKRYEFKWPRDWWQAFKERWFHGWLLERYPVEYMVKVVDIKAIYPDLHKKISMPPNDHRFRIHTIVT